MVDYKEDFLQKIINVNWGVGPIGIFYAININTIHATTTVGLTHMNGGGVNPAVSFLNGTSALPAGGLPSGPPITDNPISSGMRADYTAWCGATFDQGNAFPHLADPDHSMDRYVAFNLNEYKGQSTIEFDMDVAGTVGSADCFLVVVKNLKGLIRDRVNVSLNTVSKAGTAILYAGATALNSDVVNLASRQGVTTSVHAKIDLKTLQSTLA